MSLSFHCVSVESATMGQSDMQKDRKGFSHMIADSFLEINLDATWNIFRRLSSIFDFAEVYADLRIAEKGLTKRRTRPI